MELLGGGRAGAWLENPVQLSSVERNDTEPRNPDKHNFDDPHLQRERNKLRHGRLANQANRVEVDEDGSEGGEENGRRMPGYCIVP